MLIIVEISTGNDAAKNWEYEYADWLVESGFTRGKFTVCIFWHKERDMSSGAWR